MPTLPPPASTGASQPGARVVDDLARVSLEHQLTEISGLDGKAGILVGLVGVLLGLVFSSDFVTKHWSTLLSIGAAVLICAIVVLAVAMWPNRIRLPPSPLALLRLTHLAEDDLHQLIATATAAAIVQNQAILRRKRLSVAIATLAVIAAVATITGDLIGALP